MSDEVEYHSSELLLSVIQKEFERESERNKGLQNRAGMFLSFLGVAITLLSNYISTNSMVGILSTKDATTGQVIISLIYILFVLLVFIGLISSLILLLTILNTKRYKCLMTSGFTEESALFTNQEVALEIMKDYKTILEHNKIINDRKAKIFQLACTIITVSIILMSITIVFKPLI